MLSSKLLDPDFQMTLGGDDKVVLPVHFSLRCLKCLEIKLPCQVCHIQVQLGVREIDADT